MPFRTPAEALEAEIDSFRDGIDRTLLRENLRRTPLERMKALARLQGFAAHLRRAGEELRARATGHGGAPPR